MAVNQDQLKSELISKVKNKDTSFKLIGIWGKLFVRTEGDGVDMVSNFHQVTLMDYVRKQDLGTNRAIDPTPAKKFNQKEPIFENSALTTD